MANSKSAKKSYEQAERRRVVNLRSTRSMREATKSVLGAVSKKDKKGANNALPAMYKAIDKATKRGILKKNTASRRKSRITARVGALE